MLGQTWYDKIASSVAAAEEAAQAAVDEQTAAEKLQQDIDLTQAVAADDTVTTEEKVAILENEGVEPEIIEALIDAETTDAVASYYGVDPYWLADKKASWLNILPNQARFALEDPATMSRVGTAAMGAGLGGLAGAGLGYLAGDGMGAAIGGLAGAGLGGLGGYYLPGLFGQANNAAANAMASAAQDSLVRDRALYWDGVTPGMYDAMAANVKDLNAAQRAAAELQHKQDVLNQYGGLPADSDAAMAALFDPNVTYIDQQMLNQTAPDKTNSYRLEDSKWFQDKCAGLIDGASPWGPVREAKEYLADPANAALVSRLGMGAGLGGLAGAGLGYLAGDGMGAAIGGLAGAGLGGLGAYYAPELFQAYTNNVVYPATNDVAAANLEELY